MCKDQHQQYSRLCLRDIKVFIHTNITIQWPDSLPVIGLQEWSWTILITNLKATINLTKGQLNPQVMSGTWVEKEVLNWKAFRNADGWCQCRGAPGKLGRGLQTWIKLRFPWLNQPKGGESKLKCQPITFLQQNVLWLSISRRDSKLQIMSVPSSSLKSFLFSPVVSNSRCIDEPSSSSSLFCWWISVSVCPPSSCL